MECYEIFERKREELGLGLGTYSKQLLLSVCWIFIALRLTLLRFEVESSFVGAFQVLL